MTVIETTKNGRMPRKTLSTQLDRLDGVLDGLAEALNESVAAAVKEAVGLAAREAVSAAVREVLANPDLLRTAAAQHTPSESEPQESQPKPPTPPQQTVWGRLGNGLALVLQKAMEKGRQVGTFLSTAWKWCFGKLAQGCSRATEFGRSLKERVVGTALNTGAVLCQVWRFRTSGGLAMGVGFMSALGSYLAGPAVAALLCGLAGAVLTLAALVLIPLGRMLFASDIL